jgi:hypothetical protein
LLSLTSLFALRACGLAKYDECGCTVGRQREERVAVGAEAVENASKKEEKNLKAHSIENTFYHSIANTF